MDEINLQNYEAWYLDDLEGRLSSTKQQVLRDFLDARPELKAELDEFDDATLIPPLESYGNTDALKKSEEDARDLLFFKAAEGELDVREAERFERLSEKSEFREEYAAWKRAKLTAGSATLDKEGMYRLGLDRPVSEFNFDYYIIAAAEGVLDAAGREALDEYIGDDPERLRASALAERLRLQAPAGIFFPGKENLHRKKRRGGMVLFFRAAAALLLIIAATLVYNALLSPSGNGDPGLADVKEKTERTDTVPDGQESETAAPADTASVKAKPAAPKEVEGQPEAEDFAREALREREVRGPVEPMTAENNAPEKIPPAGDYHIKNGAPAEEGPAVDLDPVPMVEPELQRAEVPSDPEPMTPVQAEPIASPPVENYTAQADTDEYLTLSELAKATVAGKFELNDAERDRMALALAKRIADRAAEMLDAEVKKEVPDEGETLTYSMRIGNFSVSHSRQK